MNETEFKSQCISATIITSTVLFIMIIFALSIFGAHNANKLNQISQQLESIENLMIVQDNRRNTQYGRVLSEIRKINPE